MNVNDPKIRNTNLLSSTISNLSPQCLSDIVPLINDFSFASLPYAEGNLQQSANTRDEKDGTDEVALREAVMLQTQALRQD